MNDLVLIDYSNESMEHAADHQEEVAHLIAHGVLVPVEPVGTLTVSEGQYRWNEWVAVPHPSALPAREYLIVPKP